MGSVSVSSCRCFMFESCVHHVAVIGFTHIISSTASTYAPRWHPLDLWTDPAGVTELLARWKEKLAGGPQAGRSDPPLAIVKGVARQQTWASGLMIVRSELYTMSGCTVC